MGMESAATNAPEQPREGEARDAGEEGAERRLADQQWAVAATLQNSTFPLTEPILEQVKGLSGATVSPATATT